MTIDQAVEHPFFAEIAQADGQNTVNPEPITFDFEDQELNESQLRKLFAKEIEFYHKSHRTV